jgi:hypothetical protein
MDVERTIEFLLHQQARFDAQQAEFRADFEVRMKEFDAREKQASERHDREMAQIRAELRRGVRLAVQEARHERRRRKEEDAKLAASHVALER